MTKKQLILPNNISNNEEQEILNKYLEQGYEITCIGEYDKENNIYFLEKFEEITVLIPNYVAENKKQLLLKEYLDNGFTIKKIYRSKSKSMYDEYVLVNK